LPLPDDVLVVHTRVRAGADEAFNEWYDHKHLPEIVGCPGFVRSTRFRHESASGPVYLAIYELAGPWALETPEFGARRGLEEFVDRVDISVRHFTRLVTYDPGRGE
jgi:hypothetical protein